MKKKLAILFALLFRCFSLWSTVFADEIYEPAKEKDTEDVTLWLLVGTIFFIIWIIQLIARGRMLNKQGENGWKIIVPFYGRYLEYIHYWKEKYFWTNCALAAFMLLLMIYVTVTKNDPFTTFAALLWLALLMFFIINRVRMRMRTMKIFGFDRMLGLLELFGLTFVLDFLCGFSNKKQDEKEKNAQVLQEHIDNWE